MDHLPPSIAPHPYSQTPCITPLQVLPVTCISFYSPSLLPPLSLSLAFFFVCVGGGGGKAPPATPWIRHCINGRCIMHKYKLRRITS